MQVYSGYSYFVSFHTSGAGRDGQNVSWRDGQTVSGADLGQFMVDHKVFMVELIECWECYTKNPETGDGGWDIVWIKSTRNLLKKFPDFDCIITSGYPPHPDVHEVEFLDCDAY